MNHLQLQNGHLALDELLTTQLTLSVMREQLTLQRLPRHSLNEMQRHVVRPGVPVRIGLPSEDTVYAHVLPVTESERRHFNRQNKMCKNRDSGPGISHVLLARSQKQALNYKSSQMQSDLQRRDADICKAQICSSKSDDQCQPSDKDIDAGKRQISWSMRSNTQD